MFIAEGVALHRPTARRPVEKQVPTVLLVRPAGLPRNTPRTSGR